jgi:hypothetical protein
MINCCYITFTSLNIEELPNFKNVGDIVRLWRFNFNMGTNRHTDPHGSEMDIYSNWMLFCASENWKKTKEWNLKIEAYKWELYPLEADWLNELKSWVLDKFSKNSV